MSCCSVWMIRPLQLISLHRLFKKNEFVHEQLSKITMANQQQETKTDGNDGGLNLPPGFRFHPTDGEIINYLLNKVQNRDFNNTIIVEVDLNKTAPWDLPMEAKLGEKEWYFFYKKDRKYQTGQRANRATKAGYWKATGKDKEVYNNKGVVLPVGTKKMLVFYKGRAPRGDKTNWVMHEYRLEGSGRVLAPSSASSSTTNTTAIKGSTSTSKVVVVVEWVVCRVFDKTTRIKKMSSLAYQVAMVDAQINQNHIKTMSIPHHMSFQPPLPVPVSLPRSMEFPILTDFAMDLVPPYYPNISAGMSTMMPSMAGIGGTSELQINSTLFGNPLASPQQMNLYPHMGMEVVADYMGMGVAGTNGFNIVAPVSGSSLMVSQRDEQANNAIEISSMMCGVGPQSATTTIEMVDDMMKY